LCGKELTYKEPEEVFEDSTYKCWESEGGCGVEFNVEHPVSISPKTYCCPMCSKTAKLKLSFTIVHGKNMSKGASIDVAIGRSAEDRWKKINERKVARDKFRAETGTQALSIVESNRQVFGKPIKGGKLTAVSVPKNTVNKDE
jgi:hypothetical protein